MASDLILHLYFSTLSKVASLHFPLHYDYYYDTLAIDIDQLSSDCFNLK